MAQEPRAGDVARRDVPTCKPDEPLGQVRERVQSAGWNACVVVNDQRIVLGLLREAQLESEPGEIVEGIMQPGPTTFRPHVPIAEMAHFMLDHEVVSSPVTASDGRLIGLLRREDAIGVAHGHHRHHQVEAEQEDH